MPPANFERYTRLAEDTARQVTANYDSWTAFLRTSARMYKYSFSDSLMIHAQNPDATACATYQTWHNSLKRYIRMNSHGIGIIDNSGSYPKMKYLFDISQTGSMPDSPPVRLWEANENHYEVISAMLERNYGISSVNGIVTQIREASSQLAMSFLDINRELIRDNLQMSDESVDSLYETTVSDSIAYSVLTRTGINADEHINRESFEDLERFGELNALAAIGTAVSDGSERLLRDIELTVKKYEREHAETEYENGRDNLQENERNADPGFRDAGRGDERSDDTSGQVRVDEKRLSDGEPEDGMEQDVSGRDTLETSEGDRPEGTDEGGRADDGAEEGIRSDRGDETERPDGMGWPDERAEIDGGDIGAWRSGVQLSLTDDELIPPEETEQIRELQAEQTNDESGQIQSVIDLLTIDDILRSCSNTKNSRENIACFFSIESKTDAEKADFLRGQFRGGYGLNTDNGKLAVWYDDEGININIGRSARDRSIQTLSWTDAAERITQLLNLGRFAAIEEIQNAPLHERKEIAEKIWTLTRQDMTGQARSEGLLGFVGYGEKFEGFPDETAMIAEKLADPEYVMNGIEELREFTERWREHPADYVRFRYNRPDELLDRMQNLLLPRLEFTRGLEDVPQVNAFITDDEIDSVLLGGSGVEGGSQRISNYFSEGHTLQEKAAFLKNEYGDGGHCPGIPGVWHSNEEHSAKGETIEKENCIPVTLKWQNVAQKIDSLIERGLYVKPAEHYEPEIEKEPISEEFYTDTELDEHEPEPVNEIPEFIPETFDDIIESIRIIEETPEQQIEETPDLTEKQTEESEIEIIDEDDIEIPQLEPPEETSLFPFAVGDNVTYNGRNYQVANIWEHDVGLIESSRINDWVQPEILVNKELFAEKAEKTEESEEIPPETPQIAGENYHIFDMNLGEKSDSRKIEDNLRAVKTLCSLEESGLPASREQQDTLARYVGWGGLPNVFDESISRYAEDRDDLRYYLTPAEYDEAKASTLNAHFTSPTIIKAVYDAIEKAGFKSGEILEPSMGIGNFFGMLPDSMRESNLHGVELDSVSGRIAKQLYPNADIRIAGFETTKEKDSYDLVIGNVPFGDYQVFDKEYQKLNVPIHDYFIAKALDQTRPGGLTALITSHYTLDKQNDKARTYYAERADLLGAIRLPNNAFKANAGTNAVCDILFFRKKDEIKALTPESTPSWTKTGRNQGFDVNTYFIEHPDMVLGSLTAVHGRFGQELTVVPYEEKSLSDLLKEAVGKLKIDDVYSERSTDAVKETPGIAPDGSVPVPDNVRNYSFFVHDGDIFFRENDKAVKQDIGSKVVDRIKGLCDIRDCTRKLLEEQLNPNVSDAQIKETQNELNSLYDNFVSEFGIINSNANKLAFRKDDSYYLLCSLEILDDRQQVKSKADIFTSRTINPHEEITSVDASEEALALSISEKAEVDMDYMMKLTGKSEEEIVGDLKGAIFLNPGSRFGLHEYLPADEYLSGNVRLKLEEAVDANGREPGLYEDNIKALTAVQPKDLDASEIEVKLGAAWIEPEIISDFIDEVLKPPYWAACRVEFCDYTSTWNIEGGKACSRFSDNAQLIYGTERKNAYDLLEDALNLRTANVYDHDIDGKAVLNIAETAHAREKQQALKDKFTSWVFEDKDRRGYLVDKYNRIFNNTRPREYDGSHISFAGMNPEIRLREHQKNAVARILYGGNTLLAHEVGAGKTFEMTAAAMESKRLGLSEKSMFVVPNHLTEQWAAEFLRLYPAANILVARESDFTAENRKTFCSKAATNNYDAVIMGHSQFEKIQMSKEYQQEFISREISELENSIENLGGGRRKNFTVKELEKEKKKLQTKLSKLMNDDKKDNVITFEQLGVDRLFVDEAHYYKNMNIQTKLQNVAGLSTQGAAKSFDMFMKTRYMDEKTDCKGTIFATGTPVSNSMTELFTMMRYLQYDKLEEKGMKNFDAWVSTFGETRTATELSPAGKGYKAKTRLARFFNLPELMTLFKETADIRTTDTLNLPKPEIEFHNVKAEPTEAQLKIIEDISARAQAVHDKKVDARVDNMLKITSDGRKLGLDQRLLDPLLPDDPGSKLNMCVGNILKIYRETNEDKLTQLVFCDLSTPKTDTKKTENSDFNTEDNGNTFCVYDDIKSKLVKNGIPADEIKFIHEADTNEKKQKLFSDVRSGKVRVLIGSTPKMGAGTNVQDRLIALHDLDAPWRPGDLEQRAGRIARQGNMNPKVHIYRYVTDKSFDSYLWQTLETKQTFISQVMTSKNPVRSCNDIDEQTLSYAEVKALCAGDPRIKEKMNLDIDVARLKVSKANFQSQQYKLEDNVKVHYPYRAADDERMLKAFDNDIRTRDSHPLPENDFVGITIRNDFITDKENAGALLIEAAREIKSDNPVEIGEYRGFRLSINLDPNGRDHVLTLSGEMKHRVTLGDNAQGNFQRIENTLKSMEDRREGIVRDIAETKQKIEDGLKELEKEFPEETELKEKTARLNELNAELEIKDTVQNELIGTEDSEPAPDNLTKEFPDNLFKVEKDKEDYSNIPIYKESSKFAEANRQDEQYNESFRADIAARDAIEEAIKKNTRDGILDKNCVYDIMEDFGIERTEKVLAITVLQNPGNYSADLTIRAEMNEIKPDYDSWGEDKNKFIAVKADSEIIESFAQTFYDEKQSFREKNITVELPEDLSSVPVYNADSMQALAEERYSDYRLSYTADISCKEALESSARENTGSRFFDSDFVNDITAKYGSERVNRVCAETVMLNQKNYSAEIKDWAKSFDIKPSPDMNGHDRTKDIALDLIPKQEQIIVRKVFENATGKTKQNEVQKQEHQPVCTLTKNLAETRGLTKEYETSKSADISCVNSLKVILENSVTKEKKVNLNMLSEALDSFGEDRVKRVFASTVLNSNKSFEPKTVTWARDVRSQSYFDIDRKVNINSNPALVEFFISRKMISSRTKSREAETAGRAESFIDKLHKKQKETKEQKEPKQKKEDHERG